MDQSDDLTWVGQLNDIQLLEKACELGLRPCPITPQTKKIMVKRVEKALRGQQSLTFISSSTTDKSMNYYGECKSATTNLLPMPSLEAAFEDAPKPGEVAVDREMVDHLTCDVSKMNLQSTPYRTNSTSSNQYFVVNSSQNSLIVNSLKEVMELGKIDPELRFKAFINYEEAANSVLSFREASKLQLSTLDESQPSILVGENGRLPPFKNWRSIPTRLVVKYRNYVENGDVKNVMLCCLNNPRYVISSIDTPLILHEGTRRNAFHIAAERNRSNVMSILLHLMRNDMWCQACHLVPSSDTDTVEEILKNTRYRDYTIHTLDRYINSPDKIVVLCLSAR